MRSFDEFNSFLFSPFSRDHKLFIDLSMNLDFDDQVRFSESSDLSNSQIAYSTSFDLEKVINRLLKKSSSDNIRLDKNEDVSDRSI
jgi:hypothetical protein